MANDIDMFSPLRKVLLTKNTSQANTNRFGVFFINFFPSFVAFEWILYRPKAIVFEFSSIFRFKDDNNYFSNEIIQMYEQREWCMMRAIQISKFHMNFISKFLLLHQM